MIFLNGPIGVGKTALGRRAAVELGASFIDSDDLVDSSKQWFEQVLSDAKALVAAVMATLGERPVVLVAKPLRARDWAFFKGRFEAQNVTIHCITLTARLDSILSPSRGRAFDAQEQARAAEMIAQGYADRPFSDAIVETDRASLVDTTETVVAACRRLVGLATDQGS